MATHVVGPRAMTVTERFSTHDAPVWRNRADFIVNAALPEPGRFEQLWTRRINYSQFEICCIPFFLYDVALGDTVETAPQGTRDFVLSQVLKASGRHVFRAFFERPQYRYRDGVVKALSSLGAQVEWSSPSLVAVDVESAEAQAAADLLNSLEKENRLVYETGRSG